MNLRKQLAKRFRDMHLNGKWVAGTNLKELLSDLDWKEATKKNGDLNTIEALAFHINYYVAGVADVLEGKPLIIRDKLSFDRSPIQSEADWQQLLNKLWADAERFASLVESMPENQLYEGFVKEEYGNYLANINVVIEHSYYHFGQIALIKKMLRATDK
jgi:uncharacterized damage-inducible protein DinB